MPLKPRLQFVGRGAAQDLRPTTLDFLKWMGRLPGELLLPEFHVLLLTSHPTSGSFSQVAWDSRVAQVASGSLDGITLCWKRPGNDPWDLVVSLEGTTRDTTTVTLEQSLEAPPADPVWFVKLCVQAAITSKVAQGQLTPIVNSVDQGALYGKFELLALEHGVRWGPQAFKSYVRGLGWGMWLTAEHIAALGGVVSIRERAPVSRVEEHASGVWLELTDSPWEMPDLLLDRLEAFLLPIIPDARNIARAAAKREVSKGRAASKLTTIGNSENVHEPFGAAPPRIEWLQTPGSDIVINIHLAQTLTSQQAESLLEVVANWYADGLVGRFGPGFHSILGPTWDGTIVRWSVDVGFAAVNHAIEDLATRLGAWVPGTGVRIEAVRIGLEPS